MSSSEDELKKNRYWKSLSGYQKHMVLMYFYRILTDHANILDYVETYRFQQMNIDPFDLPDFVFYLKPEQLKEMALDQPLTPVPEIKKLEIKPIVKYQPEFKTMDYSGFLPEVNQ